MNNEPTAYRTSDQLARSGWTSHGWWFGAELEPVAGRPAMRAKCGGPGMCKTCHAEAGQQPAVSQTEADDREEFQVAVTVFITAPGCDESDARSGAELAVRHALRSVTVEPGVLETPHSRLGPVRVRVHKVMDATTAALNGYLAVRTTNRAYRESADALLGSEETAVQTLHAPGVLLQRLEKVTSDLHGFLEQRAKELAQPWIEKVEEAAALRLQQAEAELRRSNDLVAELRRQMTAALKGQARARHAAGLRHDKEYCEHCKTETVVTLR